VNASTQQPPKKARPIALLIVLFLLLILPVWYLWWRPMQAERALEDASLEELQQITSERPEYARAFYYYGLRLGRARQKAPAYDALSRASELAPDDEEVWIAAAGAANGMKGPEASFRVMNAFLKRHPNSVKMKEQRASLLISLQRASDGFAAAKRYKEAIRYYRIWLAEEPTASNAKQGLEKALQASGKPAEAKEGNL
jgi:tetratricopeptide (TPR) repeat protein